MTLKQGASVCARGSSEQHPKSALFTFVRSLGILSKLHVVHPIPHEGSPPEAHLLLDDQTPLYYSVTTQLVNLVNETFVKQHIGSAAHSVVALSHGPDPAQGDVVTLHPSGWLLLSLEAATYVKLGLAGKKSVTPGGDRYLVTIKLRGLYNRTQHCKRVTAALQRLPMPVTLDMMFLLGGVPQVVELPDTFTSELKSANCRSDVLRHTHSPAFTSCRQRPEQHRASSCCGQTSRGQAVTPPPAAPTTVSRGAANGSRAAAAAGSVGSQLPSVPAGARTAVPAAAHTVRAAAEREPQPVQCEGGTHLGTSNPAAGTAPEPAPTDSCQTEGTAAQLPQERDRTNKRQRSPEGGKSCVLVSHPRPQPPRSSPATAATARTPNTDPQQDAHAAGPGQIEANVAVADPEKAPARVGGVADASGTSVSQQSVSAIVDYLGGLCCGFGPGACDPSAASVALGPSSKAPQKAGQSCAQGKTGSEALGPSSKAGQSSAEGGTGSAAPGPSSKAGQSSAEGGTVACAGIRRHAWEGLLSSAQSEAAIRRCAAAVRAGVMPWAAVVVRAPERLPVTWVPEGSDFAGVGARSGGCGGPGGESVAMVLLLPGGEYALYALSGQGDQFVKFSPDAPLPDAL